MVSVWLLGCCASLCPQVSASIKCVKAHEPPSLFLRTIALMFSSSSSAQ
jgi:hypothetical protein